MPQLTPTQIDDLIDAWNLGEGSDQKLHEFLEFSFEEYKNWVKDPDCIPDMDEPTYWRVLNKL